MAVGPGPGLRYPALVMRNVLTGAALAEAITLLYAIGFFLFFGLGPTPRDYSSSWHFAARAAVLTLILGTVIAAPIGAVLGGVDGRVVHRRPLKLVALAVAGAALVPFVGRTLLPSGVGGLLVLSLPGVVLGAAAALVLERQTRPGVPQVRETT